MIGYSLPRQAVIHHVYIEVYYEYLETRIKIDRLDIRHHGASLRQMRHMRGSAHVKLGFHPWSGGLSFGGKESQFSYEELLVFLPFEVSSASLRRHTGGEIER